MTTQPWVQTAREVIAHKGYLTVDTTSGQPVEAVWGAEDDQGMEEIVGPEGAVVLDLVTAGMLVQIHDALSPTNREKFASMPLTKAVDVGWKLVARVKERA